MREIVVTQEQFDMILAMINSDIDRLEEMRETSNDEDALEMSREIVRLEKLKQTIEF